MYSPYKNDYLSIYESCLHNFFFFITNSLNLIWTSGPKDFNICNLNTFIFGRMNYGAMLMKDFDLNELVLVEGIKAYVSIEW